MAEELDFSNPEHAAGSTMAAFVLAQRRCRRLTVKPTQSPHRRVHMISQPLEL